MKRAWRPLNEATTSTGRAELLRTFAQQGGPGLAAMARLLGYEARQVPVEPPAGPRRRGRRVPVAEPDREREGILAPIPFLFAESIRFVSPEPPAKPAPADLIGTSGLGRTPGSAPQPLPLASEPRLTPALRPRLASNAPSRRVDVRALTRLLCRCEVVGKIPVEPLTAWASRITVLIDRSLYLYPFWRDQDELIELLERRLGREAIHEVEFHEGLPDPWSDDRGIHSEPPVELGTPVLALTDLGFLGRPAAREVWERLGRRWQSAGVERVALLFCEPGRWLPPLANLWNALDIEQPKRRQAAAGTTEPTGRWERAEGLLTPLAFSTSLEPALLRAIRRLLPAANFDAATEADAWFHPEVDGGLAPHAGLGAELRRRVQERFPALPEEVKRGAVAVLRAFRAGQPREVWLDEVTALAAGGDLPEGTLEPAELAASRATWNRIATTLESPGTSPTVREALAGYTRTTLEARQPAELWDDDLYRPVLARAWKAAWSDETSTPPLVPGMGPELLEGPRGEPMKWQVWQVGDSLRLTSQPLESGSPVCEVESADGRVVLFAGSRSAPVQSLSAPLPLPPSSTLLLRTDRTAVTLRRETRESEDLRWANAGMGRDRYGHWASFRVGAVVQRMRWIPPGRFWMGSPAEEEGRWEDEGPRQVEIVGTGFWLADTPCTQELWAEVMGRNPSEFKSAKRPVEQVSWDECGAFCAELAKRVSGLGPQLPFEKNWEYACRAGTDTATWLGDLKIEGENNAPLLDEIAWYGGNSGRGYELEKGYDSKSWPNKQYPHEKAGTREVATRAPNPWGLYDMLGNVHEWCEDPWRGSYDVEPDPKGTLRVIRGGSWASHARGVRAAYRGSWHPSDRGDYLGFRLARGQEAAPGEGAELQAARSASPSPGAERLSGLRAERAPGRGAPSSSSSGPSRPKGATS